MIVAYLALFWLFQAVIVSSSDVKKQTIGQTALLRNSAPILASKSLSQAAADIRQRGFCRVDNVLSPETALQLKLHINALRSTAVDSEA
jgi:hypothetical protein